MNRNLSIMMLQWIFKQHEVSHLEPLFKYMVQTSAERDQENSQQQRIKDKSEELQNLLICGEEKKNTPLFIYLFIYLEPLFTTLHCRSMKIRYPFMLLWKAEALMLGGC